MTSTTTNNNFANGTSNNVHGEQRNQSHNYIQCTFTSLSQPCLPSSSKALPPTEVSPYPNGRYDDILVTTFAICEQLLGMTQQPFSPGTLLATVELELKDFAKMLAMVARALDIIDTIPGRFKRLSLFKDVPASIRSFGKQLRALHAELHMFGKDITQTTASAPPNFWTCLFMFIIAYYRWSRLSSRINKFVGESQQLMEGFLLSSNHWRPLLPDNHRDQLERLMADSPLPPPRIYHITMQAILVRDHLGRNLPIPLEFCASWADMCIIVGHLCRGIQGSDLIERNEFELVRSGSGALVGPSTFESIIKADLEFEISIIINETESWSFTCPGCRYDNPYIQGWVTCYKCDKTFRVTLEAFHSEYQARRRILNEHQFSQGGRRRRVSHVTTNFRRVSILAKRLFARQRPVTNSSG